MHDVDTRHWPATTGETRYTRTRFNALTHRLLAAHTVLPWEDATGYGTLLVEFLDEHQPNGPTEGHLVEELAGIVWRKRRLRLAEGAAYTRGLKAALSPHQSGVAAALAHLGAREPPGEAIDAVTATPESTAAELRELAEDERQTQQALALLGTGDDNSYAKALTALPGDTREWWRQALAGELEDADDEAESYTADADGLRRFLEGVIVPWQVERRRELENRHLIRNQALGEAFDPDRLERIARYEAALDRKLERILAMLIKLQELRGRRPSVSK